MSNIIGPHYLRWDTAPVSAPWSRCKVSKLQISCPMTSQNGGVVTLTSGGNVIFSETILPGSMYDIDYTSPPWMQDLTATAIATDCIVHIEVV